MGKLHKMESNQRVARMIRAGFKNTVIEIATGENNSMIRGIRNELNLAYINEDAVAGHLRMANRIVDTRRRMIDAGIIVSFYLSLVKDRYVSIDWESLMKAHSMYLETYTNIMRGIKGNELTVNEAYILVRDLRSRSNKISLNTCTRHKCKAFYLVVADQRVKGYS